MSRVSGTAERIRLLLLGGQLGPGDRLVELQLAQRLGTGRSTIREALRKLEGQGLLTADDGGGMRVVALDERAVRELLEVRAALEALVAGRLARARADVALLRDREHGDRAFHRALAALAGNAVCRVALEDVWDRLLVAAASDVPGTERLGGREHEHGELLDAIAAGDPEAAARLARQHVLAG